MPGSEVAGDLSCGQLAGSAVARTWRLPVSGTWCPTPAPARPSPTTPPPKPSTTSSLQQPLDTNHRPTILLGDMRHLSLRARAVCEVDGWGWWDLIAQSRRARMLACHLHVEDPREGQLIDRWLIRLALGPRLGQESLAVAGPLRVLDSRERGWEPVLSGERRSSGEEPCLELAVRQDDGDPLIQACRTSTLQQLGSQLSRAVVVSV